MTILVVSLILIIISFIALLLIKFNENIDEHFNEDNNQTALVALTESINDKPDIDVDKSEKRLNEKLAELNSTFDEFKTNNMKQFSKALEISDETLKDWQSYSQDIIDLQQNGQNIDIDMLNNLMSSAHDNELFNKLIKTHFETVSEGYETLRTKLLDCKSSSVPAINALAKKYNEELSKNNLNAQEIQNQIGLIKDNSPQTFQKAINDANTKSQKEVADATSVYQKEIANVSIQTEYVIQQSNLSLQKIESEKMTAENAAKKKAADEKAVLEKSLADCTKKLQELLVSKDIDIKTVNDNLEKEKNIIETGVNKRIAEAKELADKAISECNNELNNVESTMKNEVSKITTNSKNVLTDIRKRADNAAKEKTQLDKALDECKQKEAAKEQAAREEAARQQAARERAAREQAEAARNKREIDFRDAAAILYQHCDYGGYGVPLKLGRYTMSDLMNLGYNFNNDDISSLIVKGHRCRVWLFEHDNFQGSLKVFTSNIRCFVDFGINDQISSVIVDQY